MRRERWGTETNTTKRERTFPFGREEERWSSLAKKWLDTVGNEGGSKRNETQKVVALILHDVTVECTTTTFDDNNEDK